MTIFGVIIFASVILTSCGGGSIESDAKKWAGAMQEIFTSADKYNVNIESNYSNMEIK